MAGIRLLVLCTGNIGRSPLAAILLEKALADGLGVAVADLVALGVVVSSAGTDAPEGRSASRRGVAVAAAQALDLSGHGATRLTLAAIRRADRIYVMDTGQVAAVIELAPEAASKTELFAGDGIEIPDPRCQDDRFFSDVVGQIAEAVAQRSGELVAEIGEIRREPQG